MSAFDNLPLVIEPAQLAERLDALYEYMAGRLLHANLHNNPAALDEVVGLLGSLREAWAAIADQVGG